MKSTTSRISLIATSAIAASMLVACGGGGSSAPAANGTLAVSMTDAPACGFDAVNVTVNKVRVHQSADAGESDGGWTDITLDPARKINLLSLTNGALEELGQTPLSAGHYSQLRLVLDSNTNNAFANSVIPTGGVEQSLKTPSGQQSGIKLVNEFEVVAGQRVDLVLDFDACKSVVTKGNGTYGLKPVIKVIPTAVNGISGFIDAALLGSHVTVSAQQNGVIVSSTVPKDTGEFFLARLVPGNYDVVITADNRAASVVAAVPVTSTTATTALSTSTARITLATSAMATISGTASLTPASATDETVVLAAKQSFAAGPTVVVKYQGANLDTGAYTLNNLPVAAPQYALYSSLPLVFAPSLSTVPGTGKYRVDASATGYATISRTPLDISTANLVNVNFALVP